MKLFTERFRDFETQITSELGRSCSWKKRRPSHIDNVCPNSDADLVSFLLQSTSFINSSLSVSVYIFCINLCEDRAPVESRQRAETMSEKAERKGNNIAEFIIRGSLSVLYPRINGYSSGFRIPPQARWYAVT